MEFLKRAKLRTVQQTKNYDKIIIWWVFVEIRKKA
jgi:hypothetical protein